MFSTSSSCSCGLIRTALLLAGLSVAWGAPTPSDLRCEWRVNNQAVRDICPEFYWETEGQRACQVLVATQQDGLAEGKADAWDSGKVESRLPIIEYAGEPLANETPYFWKVRLWGEDDQAGAWSQVQRFTTNFKPLPALRPHMRYFVNFGGNDSELMASRYDLSFRPGPNEVRPAYIGVHYCLMATMVIPSAKYDDLKAWCAEQGLGDEPPETMWCHFRTDREVTLHVGAERAENPREKRLIPGWDPANDRNGDGRVDDEEFADLANPQAHAREMKQARIPVYFWGPPRDDFVMNIGHPDYQRYLAEKYMPDQLEGGYDGFFVDTTPADVPGAGANADVLEYPRGPGEEDAWMRDMQTAMAKVKIALPDSVLTANGWSADPFVLDGMESEGWLNITRSGRGFDAALERAAKLDRRGKIQLLQYNPIFEPERSEFGPKVPIELERDAIFGLATYYLVAGDYTYYGYGRHPYAKSLSWYNPAADFDVGKPEGPYERIVLQQDALPEEGNLVPNGDFEIDEDGDGLPDVWEIVPPVVFDEEVVKSGKRSVRIDSDNVQINNFSKNWLTLKPNTTYTLSAWVKTEEIKGGAGAQVYVYDFDGAESGGITIVFHGTNDWTRATQTFTTGDDAEGRVNFRVYGSTGTAWFDDIRILEGAFGANTLYTRRFSKALVVVRPSQPAVGWGDGTAIDYDLDGTYRPLQADGTLGEATRQIKLRLGEAGILMPLH